jgi:hypothetical protein
VNFSFFSHVGIFNSPTTRHGKATAMSNKKKYFTIDQARAMLPLLRLIVTDIALAHRELTERKSLIRKVQRQHDNKPRFHLYGDEVLAIHEELKQDELHLDKYVSELEGLGVILRSAHDGVVDFPTVVDDQPAFYTWQMDQTDVVDFHFAGESTADRKPIVAN